MRDRAKKEEIDMTWITARYFLLVQQLEREIVFINFKSLHTWFISLGDFSVRI